MFGVRIAAFSCGAFQVKRAGFPEISLRFRLFVGKLILEFDSTRVYAPPLCVAGHFIG
jgi:hypothetical protein